MRLGNYSLDIESIYMSSIISESVYCSSTDSRAATSHKYNIPDKSVLSMRFIQVRVRPLIIILCSHHAAEITAQYLLSSYTELHQLLM